MKRTYEKPMISFEEMELDTPIASGCDLEHISDVQDLLAQGWFNASYETCNKDQYIANDEQENWFWDDNKLCYYSAVAKAFTS